MAGGARSGEAWTSRRAPVALVLFATSAALAFAFGDVASLCAVVLSIGLSSRDPLTSGALELGALSGWALGARTPGPLVLVTVGGVGLVALFAVRAQRGRSAVSDPRLLWVGLGLGAVCAARFMHAPRVTAAAAWLVLCGWVSTVALGLFTEGFAPRLATAEAASGGLSPEIVSRVDSLRQRAIARGGVGRTALSAALATGADFLVFHALIAVLLPGVATLVGAGVGGGLNFAINRRWAFDGHGSLTRSAVRYVWVSATSALLSSATVSLALLEPAVSPVSAWLVARALSFLGWNYPMQRDHVFSHRSRAVGGAKPTPTDAAPE